MTETPAEDFSDGRAAKRVGSRRRLIIAGLKRVQSGHFRFTAQDIADDTGMHRRSVHAIFGAWDDYLQALCETHGVTIREAITHYVRDRERSLAQLVLIGK